MIDEKKYKGHTPGPWESEEWDEMESEEDGE